MLIYNGQIIAGGGTIVLPMTRAEYEANKAILDSADVWVDLIDEPDQVATADQVAYSVSNVQKGMGYIGDIATKAVAKVEPTDTALYLHEVGEYFINKDGDACKTDVQISVGGTITLGTNCHVVDGVANDINSNLMGKLVWENSAPASAFSSQSIIITNDKPIKYFLGIADSVTNCFKVGTSGEWAQVSMGVSSGKIVRRNRGVSISVSGNDYTVSINNCTRYDFNSYGSVGTSSTENDSLIPIALYALY